MSTDCFGHIDRLDPRVVARRSGVSVSMARAALMAQGFRVLDEDYLFDAPTINPHRESPHASSPDADGPAAPSGLR